MNVLAVLAALAVTTVAFSHLAATDPKRLRVFGQTPPDRPRWAAAALVTALLPGAFLLAAGDGAGFTIWLGAITVAGWGVAALSPDRAGLVRNRLGGVLSAAIGGLQAAGRTAASLAEAVAEVPRLKARIALLEQKVAELEALAAPVPPAEVPAPRRRAARPRKAAAKKASAAPAAERPAAE